VPVLPWQ